MLTKEFCAENMELVPAAVAAGAARIELCDNLAVGGTTPSYGVIRAAVAHARRLGAAPRAGVFLGMSSTCANNNPKCTHTRRQCA